MLDLVRGRPILVASIRPLLRGRAFPRELHLRSEKLKKELDLRLLGNTTCRSDIQVSGDVFRFWVL